MKTVYPLFTICILVILFYTLSAALVSMGLVSRSNHRKFWNAVLLITFLGVCLIGLLIVFKINYKLEIPFYDELLSYHVDFGIGMIVIGLIHLWWHLGYYLHLFKHEKNKESAHDQPLENDLDPFLLKISALMLGSTSIIAQILLLREFLSVYNGNEMVIGLVLANWMVLTGIGASLGKRPLRIKKVSIVIVSGLLLLSILPFIITFLINFLKNKIFPVGAMINVFQLFFGSLVMLIPLCLVSGFLFTFISRCYSEIRGKNESGSVYGFESIGSVAGGLIGGLVFLFLFSSIESLLVLAVVNSLFLFLIGLKIRAEKLAGMSILVAFLAFITLFFHPEIRIRSWIYLNQKIEVSKDSPYGNIVITRQENMWSVFNNNILLFDSENFMHNEEAVHFAMVQYSAPSNVLLISGGLSGQLTEIKKYSPLSVDYVEDNQWLLTLMKDSIEKIMTKGIFLHSTDPSQFIRKTTKKYDVVVLNLSAPSTLQVNRFYTLEFYTRLKEKLSQGAVLSFGVPAPANYLNSAAVDLYSTIFATLKKVFQTVIIIPGETNYFLASDSQLTYNIVKALQMKGIQNRYVNQDYFNDLLLKTKGETILSSLNTSAELNQDLQPVLYQQELSYWLSYFNGKFWLMAFAAGGMALFFILSGNTSSITMFLTGFSSTGLEILVLFALQIYFGNIYVLTSFVFAGFMLGLAIGSFVGKSFTSYSTRKYLCFNQMLIGIIAFAAAALILLPGKAIMAPLLVYNLYLGLIIVIGSLTGFQFTKATLVRKGNYAKISGKTYSYDLYGSGLGALILTIYTIPKIGIISSAIFIGFLNLAFGIYLTLRKNEFGFHAKTE